MRLKYCTFTGADDRTSRQRLAETSIEYRFVEWAIPYSPHKQGQSHYPTDEWIDSFLEVCAHANRAIHLCHQSLNRLAEGDPIILRRIDGFQRVQLNLGFEFDLSTIDIDNLAKQVAVRPQQRFILQYGQKTKHLLPHFRRDNPDNLDLLFDDSAGSGQEAKSWPTPIKGLFCGYAGGIGPGNVSEKLRLLLQIVPRNRLVSIDMETRIRTPETDMFDIEGRVQDVLRNVVRATSTVHYRHSKFSIQGWPMPRS